MDCIILKLWIFYNKLYNIYNNHLRLVSNCNLQYYFVNMQSVFSKQAKLSSEQLEFHLSASCSLSVTVKRLWDRSSLFKQPRFWDAKVLKESKNVTPRGDFTPHADKFSVRSVLLSLTAVNKDVASIVPTSVFPARMRLDSLDPVSFNSLKKKNTQRIKRIFF